MRSKSGSNSHQKPATKPQKPADQPQTSATKQPTPSSQAPAEAPTPDEEARDLFLKKRISWKTWLKIGLTGAVIVAIIVYLAWDIIAKGPLTRFLMNRDQLVAAVESWGVFAPLLYIILQVVQTVVAPIPGQIVGSIGGFVFGVWGILWTSIGTLIGCFIVFKIARRFGRPLLEKIFKKSSIERFDFIINSKSASLALFLIFLLPGFPDDIICYIAGLTTIPIRKLMFIVLLGRLPVITLTNYIGAGLVENTALVAAVSIIGVIILGIGVWQRDRITKFLKRDSDPQNSTTQSSDLEGPEKTSNKKK